MNKFIHLGFAFPGVPKMRDLEPVISSLAEDWVRYSATNWILWTSKPSAEIFSSLLRYIDDQDQFLVAPIDLDYCTGKLPPWIWNWVNSKGRQITVDFVPHGLARLPPPSN